MSRPHLALSTGRVDLASNVILEWLFKKPGTCEMSIDRGLLHWQAVVGLAFVVAQQQISRVGLGLRPIVGEGNGGNLV